MITLCNILGWSLSVLSCWDSFWLLYIKQLSSKDTRVSNILRMLVIWWATSTANCQIGIPCSQMSCSSESFSSPLSPTGQQVTAVLGHQILLWETAFYYDMADDWSKNQLWNWLSRSPNCLSQYTPLSTWSSLSNFHTLSTFLGDICHWNDKTSMQTLCFKYFHFQCFCTGILFVHIDRVNVSKNSEIILKAARLSLHILIFWQNHFSMICQVWLHCLQ